MRGSVCSVYSENSPENSQTLECIENSHAVQYIEQTFENIQQTFANVCSADFWGRIYIQTFENSQKSEYTENSHNVEYIEQTFENIQQILGNVCSTHFWGRISEQTFENFYLAKEELCVGSVVILKSQPAARFTISTGCKADLWEFLKKVY